jgi:hypothetical protein
VPSFLAAALWVAGAAAPPGCVRQPLAPAIEQLQPIPPGMSQIAFAAEPSLQYPGRAWAVRLHRPGGRPAVLEIVQLRRRDDCNVYYPERRWRASVPVAEFDRVARTVMPFAVPRTSDALGGDPMNNIREIGLDGTGITLALSGFGWAAKRQLHHGGADGAEVSALFRALVAKHVPVPDLPTEDWRTPR